MDVWTWVWVGLGIWVCLVGIGLVIRLMIYKESVPLVEAEKEKEILPKIETNKTSGGAVRHDISGRESVVDSERFLETDTGDEAFAEVMGELSNQTSSPKRISKIKTKKIPADEAISSAPEKPKDTPKKKPQPEAPKPTYVPSKENVVTEKTRGDIDNLITGIRSLSKEIHPAKGDEVDLNDPELDHLRESQIVRQLASTLVSEIKTDEAKEGKYSKMSLDASLFFEEEDAVFFEKEFEWNPDDEDSITDKELKESLSQESKGEE